MAKAAAAKAKVTKASVRDFDTIIEPIITEKTMSLMQEQNKVTLRVAKSANRAEIKKAFEAVFGVKAVEVNIINVRAKETTRGGRYKGSISGFKKAVVTVAEGEALDLFKE
jgi:large subunit ribosomal protein L23